MQAIRACRMRIISRVINKNGNSSYSTCSRTVCQLYCCVLLPLLPSAAAVQLVVSSFRVCSGDQAQTQERRPFPAGGKRSGASCANGSRTQHAREPISVHTSSMGISNSRANDVPVASNAGKIACVCNTPPPPFPVSAQQVTGQWAVGCGQWARGLPCNLAPTMTWTFLRMPQTLT